MVMGQRPAWGCRRECADQWQRNRPVSGSVRVAGYGGQNTRRGRGRPFTGSGGMGMAQVVSSGISDGLPVVIQRSSLRCCCAKGWRWTLPKARSQRNRLGNRNRRNQPICRRQHWAQWQKLGQATKGCRFLAIAVSWLRTTFPWSFIDENGGCPGVRLRRPPTEEALKPNSLMAALSLVRPCEAS